MWSSFSTKVFGLAFPGGVAALVVGAVVGLAWRRVSRRPAPVAGLLLVGAAAFALSRVPDLIAPYARGLSPLARLPSGLLAGLVLLAAGGFVTKLLPERRVLGGIAAIAGAGVIATRAGLPDVTWIHATTGVAIVVGGTLLAEFDRRWRDECLALALVAVSALGVYAAVPETTQAAVLLASAAPLVFLAWPRCLASLGAPGAFAMAGLLAWTVVAGGSTRPASIVGGFACMGFLAVEPIARALDPARVSALDVMPRRWRFVGAVAGQLVLVVMLARVAARARSVVPAAAISLAALAAALGIAIVAVRVTSRLGSGSADRSKDVVASGRAQDEREALDLVDRHNRHS